MRRELEPLPQTADKHSGRFATTVAVQRTYFEAGNTRSTAFRKEQLTRLKTAVLQNETVLREALHRDLHKSETESYLSEIFLVVNEINHAIRNLRRWTKRKRVRTDLVQQPARSYRIAEPLGVVLVLAPWNYPLQLLFVPLVGAIAAGNCVVLKPSELAPASSSAVARLIADTFPPDFVAVVEGGPETAEGLLGERFDHIFFTGGGRVGRKVLRSAAEHLTPVTLELGGKSPCVVDRTADIDLAARRIAFARFINAGQTCVSPDYLLVHRSVEERFTEALVGTLRTWWGEASTPIEDFSRIVNERHFDRLSGLIGIASEEGARIVYGGVTLRSERYIAPTIITGVRTDSALMEEEIFGPILPVIGYDTEEEAFAEILSRPKPLAAYLFSKDRGLEARFEGRISAGGMCLNDCLSQMTTTGLPFGGVGESGMGAYHGTESFRTFSHYKSVMRKAAWLDIPVKYPPYERRQGMIRLMRRLFS